MFGYIKPCKALLSEDEAALFKSYYCGLCRRLGNDYGLHCKPLINYECVFLALLMDSMHNPIPAAPGRCFLPPFQRCQFAAGEALGYAAAINVLLSYYKIKDNWQDDRQARAWVGEMLLRSSAAEASLRYPDAARDIESNIADFNRLEAQQPEQPNELSHQSGIILQSIFKYCCSRSPYQEALGWAGYHIGRWVYLVDAFDDLPEDLARHRFNPFLGAYTKDIHNDIWSFRESLAAVIEAELYISLDEIAKSLFLIKPSHHTAILTNMVCEGMRLTTARILQNKPGTKKNGRSSFGLSRVRI